MDLHDTLVRIGLKIAVPLSFIILLSGIVFLFYDIWAGVITIISAIVLFVISIISLKWYRRDKESYLRAHIYAIAWRDFGILLFFFFFFLFLTLTSFYSGDMEGIKIFGILSLIFLFLSIVIGWQNKKISL